jgi:hypothetical protein
MRKTPAFIALRGIPVQKRHQPLSSTAALLSPEIYSLSGLVDAVIS